MIENRDNPKISIMYDGIYTDRLNWRTDRLAQFANEGDLRTYVYIVTGDEMDKPQVTALGDILAWKSILSAANPFSKPSGLGKPSEVFHSTDEDGRLDANIVINHQILIERVKQQNDGQIKPEGYVQVLNEEVRRGLRSVLIAEKTDLFKYTGGIMGLYVGGMVAAPAAGHFQAELLQQYANPGPVGGLEEAAYLYMYWASRVGQVVVPLVIAGAGADRYRKFNQAIKKDPSQYIASLRDMNPVKYPADALRGLSYLRKNGKSLVEVGN